MLELKTLYECDNENLLRSYGAFLKDGKEIVIAMEFMDAGSLQNVLRAAGKIPENMLSMITG